MDEPNPLEAEDVDRMLYDLRLHLVADHILRASTGEELLTLIESQLASAAAMKDGLRNYAMVLRVCPESREEIADHLDMLAESIWTPPHEESE